jgi:hypothetical protein
MMVGTAGGWPRRPVTALAAAGAGDAVLFAANLSTLWAELPLAERFERAAGAGFGAVELWWPGAAAAESLPALTARWNLRLALLNFDAGDMAAGERGLATDPGRREQVRANVPAALRIARACGCRRLNLLLGLRQERYPLGEQLACARDNVAWARWASNTARRPAGPRTPSAGWRTTAGHAGTGPDPARPPGPTPMRPHGSRRLRILRPEGVLSCGLWCNG